MGPEESPCGATRTAAMVESEAKTGQERNSGGWSSLTARGLAELTHMVGLDSISQCWNEQYK